MLNQSNLLCIGQDIQTRLKIPPLIEVLQKLFVKLSTPQTTLKKLLLFPILLFIKGVHSRQ